MSKPSLACALLVALLAADGYAQIQSVVPVRARKTPRTTSSPVTPGSGGSTGAVLPPGANDDCSSATSIAGPGVFPYDATSATTGSQGQTETLCDQNGLTDVWNDVWFRWTASCTGTAEVATCGLVSWDSKIAVYPGGGCPAGAAIGCNDDACGGASRVTFACVAGSEYTIQIGVFPGAIPGAGQFSLACNGAAVGDPCTTPIAIAGPGPHAVNTTAATTGAEGQTNAACSALGSPAIDRDVWFTWTSPDRGIVTLDFCAGGGSLDTKVAVYRGSGCPSGAAIACSDDSDCGARSVACFEAQDGEAFTIQVGSSPGFPGGNASFTLSVAAPDVLLCGIDDGSAEYAVGYTPSGGIAWMQRFGEPGEVRAVASVATAFGSLAFAGNAVPNGAPAKVAVWEDPNDDGDPSDAILLALKDVVVAGVDTDLLTEYALDTPVVVTGRFFVGAGLAHGLSQFPAPLDARPCSALGRSWVFGDAGGTLDYATFAANDFPPVTVEVALGIPGAWLLRPDCGLPGEPCETLVVAADSVMPDPNWQLSFILGSGPDAIGHQQVSPGGSNTYRRVEHLTPTPTAVVSLLAGNSIDPAVDGAVQTLDVELEVRADAFGGAFALIFRQGGTWFYSNPLNLNGGTWTHYAFQGLTAASFADVSGGPATLDLSCNGTPFEIGFLTFNGGSSPVNFDVDDFRVDLRGIQCVSPCCDEEAEVDAQGNPVYPAGITEIPPGYEVDEDRGNIDDIYGTQVTETIDWVQDIGCSPSLGGTVPTAAMTPNILGTLAGLGITGYTLQEIQDQLNEWENAILGGEVGYVNSLPTAISVTNGAGYTPPAAPHAADASECYAFGGRDAIYVHDIQFQHILNGMANDCAANTDWVESSTSPADTTNPEYYSGGYFKTIAEEAWAGHIAKFYAQAAPNGIKNRHLVVCYSSNDRADVAAKAILRQISDAMRFGTGVVDPSGNNDTTKFGTPSFVIVSQGLGSLYTDVAMSAAVTHPGLGAGFIANHCKAHVALHGAFKGTRYATALVAAWGYTVINDPSLAFALCSALWLTQGLADALGFGCAPDLSLACLITGPIVQNTALLDMVPLVADTRWRSYIESVPTPTVTVVGAHPTLMFPLKNVLAPGFDDGFINVDSQLAQEHSVILWPSLLEVENAGINVPWLLYSRMFDMGMALKDFWPLRAAGFYVDQVVDRMVTPAVLLPWHVASAATPYYSPTGMIESIPPSSSYNPRTEPVGFEAIRRHSKHYSFIQSSADHFSGTNGRIISFQPANQYWPSFASEPNFEETFVIVDPEMYDTYSTSGYAGDDDPLVRKQDLPAIHERVRGKVIYVPYIQNWKIKWRPKWLWKRTYHLPVDTVAKHQCDYVYGSLLKGDSTPCGETGLAFCPCDANNGPCWPFVPNAAPIRGCRNSIPGNVGGLLTATGIADRSDDAAGIDQVYLHATAVTNSSCLFFQGTTKLNNGMGAPFGDGIRCIAGSIVRLKIVQAAFGGNATYPEAGDQPLSIKGFIPLFGGTRHYQVWYRNGAQWCTNDTFNLTNGYSIAWSP